MRQTKYAIRLSETVRTIAHIGPHGGNVRAGDYDAVASRFCGGYGTMDQLLAAIERQAVGRDAPLVVALDGRSGTGKSTLAARLAVTADAVVITCDDFYAGGTDAEWLARTPEQRATCCIDWRRLEREVVEPLRAGRCARYHPFDFAKGTGLARHTIARDPRPIVILDGAYSGGPDVADIVDIAALLDLADGVRRGRLIAREGPAFMAAWHPVWDAAEDHYFTNICPPSRYDFTLIASCRPGGPGREWSC